MKPLLAIALSSFVILHSSFAAAPRNVVLFIADEIWGRTPVATGTWR